MFDFNSLIGLEIDLAKEILTKNGYKNINITLNSKHNIKCDSKIVCAVRNHENEIDIICGEFYVDIKEN